MKKKILIGISALILIGAIIFCIFFLIKREENKEEDIKVLLKDYEQELGSIDNYKFDVRYDNSYQLTQHFKGVRVYGASIIAIKDKEEVTKILDYRYQIPDDFDIKPKNKKEDLLKIALKQVGNDAKLINAELIIYPISEKEFTLAYLFEFTNGTIIISDKDQSIISSPSIFDTSSLYKTPLEEEDIARFQIKMSKYQLYDKIRNIEVYTIKDSYEYIPSMTFLKNSEKYYEEVIWHNLEEANKEDYYAIKTMQNVAKVYDYYKENFDFRSIKMDEDYKLKVYVNLDKILDEDNKNIYYPYANNAALAYFNEDDIRIYFGKDNIFNEDIEVVSHEYTHGLFRQIIEPDGSMYNSAINEGYADAMGLIIGAYYQDGYLDGTIADRNIKDSTFKLSDYTLDTEEHDASFLISRVAYLMSIEEDLEMDLYDLGNLWFKSLYHLPKNIVNYSDVELAVLTEALILGYSRDEVKLMARIFESVGYPNLYDVVVKDIVSIRYGNTSVSEENEEINEEEIYMSYLKNKEYESLTTDWEMEPEFYSLYDIDGNGILELMISFNDYGFGNNLILTYDPVDKKVEKVWDKLIYGGLRYHEGRKEIEYTEIKPFYGASVATFATLVNGEIISVRNVVLDGEAYYVYEGNDRREVTKEEYSSYFDDLIYFEEKELSSI